MIQPMPRISGKIAAMTSAPSSSDRPTFKRFNRKAGGRDAPQQEKSDQQTDEQGEEGEVRQDLRGGHHARLPVALLPADDGGETEKAREEKNS
jgi:hypothetical protein